MKIFALRRIAGYCHETVEELKKCSWPTSQQLVKLTSYVIWLFILLTLFVLVCDMIFQYIVRLVIQQ